MPPKDTEEVKEKDKVKEKDNKVDTQEATGIDPSWLKGLMFRGAKPKEVEEDGRKRVKFTPFERALEPGDILDWKDKGPSVVIVTKDGKKYTVNKKGSK